MNNLTSQRMLSREDAFAPFFPQITIELTSRCNLKCPYCANPSLKREYGEMSADMIERLANECAANGYQIIAVHGVGEPLLRKDLERYLALFRDLKIWFGWITSNGTLLSVERMRLLADAGVLGMFISVDTLDQELYSKTRGGKLSKVIANVQNAAAAFPNIQFCVGLMNHRTQTMGEEALDLFRSLFKDTPNVYHHIYENGRFPGAAEDWRRIDPATGSPICSGDDCGAWAHYFTIAIDGRVSLCCADQEAEYALGDVNKESIHDIWFKAVNQNIFRSILLGLHDCPSVCTGCNVKASKRTLEDADPVLRLPYFAVRAEADTAKARGDLARAEALLRHLKRRNPWDTGLDQEIAEAADQARRVFEVAECAQEAKVLSAT